mmetsp:Transcript_112062/g.289564  ORF Transcript_112062/g.289564 Transcript_112062/m.289564 type:complete len:224 (-) Transcript_112062:116-787(-)
MLYAIPNCIHASCFFRQRLKSPSGRTSPRSRRRRLAADDDDPPGDCGGGAPPAASSRSASSESLLMRGSGLMPAAALAPGAAAESPVVRRSRLHAPRFSRFFGCRAPPAAPAPAARGQRRPPSQAAAVAELHAALVAERRGRSRTTLRDRMTVMHMQRARLHITTIIIIGIRIIPHGAAQPRAASTRRRPRRHRRGTRSSSSRWPRIRSWPLSGSTRLVVRAR